MVIKMSNSIQKPEFKWYFGLPFSKVWNKGAKDYYKDRELYDLSNMKESEKIRHKQAKTIYDTDTFIYFILTTLWTLPPPLITLPSWLSWMNLGMTSFGWSNWGNQIALTLVPATISTFIHKLPKLMPSKKVKIIIDVFLKILPVMILILCGYLIITEKNYKQFKYIER